MIRGCIAGLLAVELRLPVGFAPVDPRFPPEVDDGLRVEIIDEDLRVRAWDWPFVVPWHEALGYRIADDGAHDPCVGCGEFCEDVNEHGEDVICARCAEDGFLCDGDPEDDDEEAEEAPDGKA